MTVAAAVRRHRAVLFVSLVVVGIAVVTYLTIRAGTDNHASSSSPTTTHQGASAELIRLLQHGRSVDTDVTFTGATASAQQFTAHLWRRGPLARLDVQTGAGDAATHSAQLVTGSGPYACNQAGTAPWSCATKPGLALAENGVVPPELLGSLAKFDVSVRDDNVAGSAVRCFTITLPPTTSTTVATDAAGKAQLCVTPDGVPVRVEAGSTHLEATSIGRSPIPDSVFDLPAAP